MYNVCVCASVALHTPKETKIIYMMALTHLIVSLFDIVMPLQ